MIDLTKEKAYGRVLVSISIPIYIRDEAFEQVILAELDAVKKDVLAARQLQLQRWANRSKESTEAEEVN